MGGDLSILSMIVQASLVVQIVIGILLAASLMSWAIIFRKSLVARRLAPEPLHDREGTGTGLIKLQPQARAAGAV